MDLEKPLKKQLDKYALEPTVYFGVVFYVPSVSQLQQEITRYQYYLQLKKDILEGNIPCTLEQAIQLAGLAVQADFGDFDQYESQDFLQKFAAPAPAWLLCAAPRADRSHLRASPLAAAAAGLCAGEWSAGRVCGDRK